jgi:hypothetical protein
MNERTIKTLIQTAIAAVLALLVMSAFTGCSSDGVSFAPTSSPTTTHSTKAGKPQKTAEAKPKMTKHQEQAVGAARDYLDGQHFSKKGLIHQLKYEGHSTKDATFAVNYLHPDWNKQAAGAAKDYLDGQHFSRSGLIHQLEYEGYTHSQAVYGTKKAGL